MTIGNALYQLLIGPLELLFETVFAMANRVIGNPGLSIIFLSLAMNFLVLPLYRRADIMQAEERDQAAKLKPWVDHIKKTFKGDQQFMMLQTYYRQNGYKQTDALKGSVSLLLEIPFFIAAYRFLSGLSLLQGVSFGPIRDLGVPDGLLMIGGVSVNLLPILMTAINAVSAAVYMKGFPLKSKLQMYGIALIFLIFLYTSPAGLVFYWTLNNVFSLLKNIFYKLKKPRLVLSVLFSAVGLIGLGYILFVHPFADRKRMIKIALLLLLLQLPLIGFFIEGNRKDRNVPALTKDENRGFLYGCIFLAVLTGALIPSAVINTSPEEFINIQAFKTPLWYIATSLLTATGLFVVWFNIFYHLAGNGARRAMNAGVWIASAAAVISYMFFGKDHGNLSDTLQYDVFVPSSAKESLLNLVILFAAAALLYYIWKKKDSLCRVMALSMCIAVVGMATVNITSINKTLSDTKTQLESAAEKPKITLNKNGKNVIVLMLDRAISSYFPFILEEKPELQEQFAGFTYYPNTISYGGITLTGFPAILGGYDYRPANLNARSDELLVDKHNEALKIMPVLFEQNGYDVTVCDPSLAGYRWIPDLSIYDDYPDIHRYITKGKFSMTSFVDKNTDKIRNHNFFCYSLYKIAPVFLQETLYNKGLYNAADTAAAVNGAVETTQTRDSLSTAHGITQTFLDCYSVLYNLPFLTEINDSDQNTFLLMVNDTAHNGIMLKEPDYTPEATVDNTAYDEAHHQRRSTEGKTLVLSNDYQVTHYHGNAASLIQLGKWMDYLRENDVYDNTRIIIVADHGQTLNQFPEYRFGQGGDEDVMNFNPLMIVKDFYSESFETDYQFMTNADTPVIAFQGLIDDPVNPFTGRSINSDGKNDEKQYIFRTSNINITEYTGTQLLPGFWYSVHDDIFDLSNWEKIGETLDAVE